MALLHRRKAFSTISRYRLCGRSFFSSLPNGRAASASGKPDPSSLSGSGPMQSFWQFSPAVAVKTRVLSGSTSLVALRSYYSSVATYLGGKHSTPCCDRHKCTAACGCLCTSGGNLDRHVRNCTTQAYPPPVPPGEYHGGDEAAEADGAPLNVDEVEGVGPLEDADNMDMPPFDNPNYPEDDNEDYQDEDPPPDPEEKLLYSPSDED